MSCNNQFGRRPGTTPPAVEAGVDHPDVVEAQASQHSLVLLNMAEVNDCHRPVSLEDPGRLLDRPVPFQGRIDVVEGQVDQDLVKAAVRKGHVKDVGVHQPHPVRDPGRIDPGLNSMLVLAPVPGPGYLGGCLKVLGQKKEVIQSTGAEV